MVSTRSTLKRYLPERGLGVGRDAERARRDAGRSGPPNPSYCSPGRRHNRRHRRQRNAGRSRPDAWTWDQRTRSSSTPGSDQAPRPAGAGTGRRVSGLRPLGLLGVAQHEIQGWCVMGQEGRPPGQRQLQGRCGPAEPRTGHRWRPPTRAAPGDRSPGGSTASLIIVPIIRLRMPRRRWVGCTPTPLTAVQRHRGCQSARNAGSVTSRVNTHEGTRTNLPASARDPGATRFSRWSTQYAT